MDVEGRKRGGMLVAGATGFIGHFVAEAAVAAGLPTYLLCRPGGSNISSKAAAIKHLLQDQGAIAVEGCIEDKEAMTELLKRHCIEVVISAVGGRNIMEQLCLIEAIQAVPTITRFLPSEFGNDVDRAEPVEPGLSLYAMKRKIRRATEASGIPYTYICCNSIAGWPYHDTHRPSPPLNTTFVSIYGDGDTKAYFVDGADVGRLTVEAAYDGRTLNKTLHFRPECNCLTMNELWRLWEGVTGRSFGRVFVGEEELLKAAAGSGMPGSIIASIVHDVFINGCQVGFSINVDDGRRNEVEIGGLFPSFAFRYMDDFFRQFVPGHEKDGDME